MSTSQNARMSENRPSGRPVGLRDVLFPGRFYKQLWQEADAARKRADADLHELVVHYLAVLDALEREDDPSPIVRGAVRKLRAAVEATERRGDGVAEVERLRAENLELRSELAALRLHHYEHDGGI